MRRVAETLALCLLIFLILAGGAVGDAKPQDGVAHLPDRSCMTTCPDCKPFCIKHP